MRFLSLVAFVAACSSFACSPSKSKTDTAPSNPQSASTGAAGTSAGTGGGASGDASGGTTGGTGSATGGATGGAGVSVAVVGTVAVSTTSNVDMVVAMPLGVQASSQRSGAVAAPVSAGQVAIEIPKDASALRLADQTADPGTGNWAVALIDSSKTDKLDQVVGFMGLESGSDAMTALPIKDATTDKIDFGSVSVASGEAVSSTKLSDAASSFDLQLTLLSEIASTDSVTKGLKNVYANTSADGKTFYEVEPFFIYRATDADAKNKYTLPDDIKYVAPAGGTVDFGYGFYFKVNDPATAKFDDICAATKRLTLEPPAGTTLHKNSVDYTSDHPLSNDGSVASGSGTNVQCAIGEFYMSGSHGQENYGFNFGGGGYTGAILPGVWKMKINDKLVAEYDLASYAPVAGDGKPLVYVPAVKATVNADNKIDKIEVKFFFWNRTTATFQEVTDLKVLKSSLKNLDVYLVDNDGINSGCTGNRIEEQGALANVSGNAFEFSAFKDGKWRYMGDLSTTEKVASVLTVKYEIDSMSVNFEYRPAHDACN